MLELYIRKFVKSKNAREIKIYIREAATNISELAQRQ